ncbi:NAD(P)/FAD-dependent oxidoreductase [Halorussus salilacus]|uniref:NAD(P)/FAD-dependent oxidoreductase n=1 Tax=Halorussus salilacus TaxID=2953750 RepID=UPI00209F2F0B|nr:NAD(P)/FAD-dependent oxidoreductase [Halorussus salilacus]USZ69046.1 NAD(P)/FAD-dependent oxidoreductase [Halorussus salilacus]
MTEVVVAGGGLAGLVAARRLAEAGAEVRLFERHGEVGGRVRSLHRDGFVFDRGFQVLFTAYPAARRELDYGALDLRRFAPGAVVARPGHRAVLSDPLGDPSGAVETLFNRDVTTLDKLRVLRLRRELAGKSPAEIFGGPDATIREYLDERGFSSRFLSNFAEPFYGGITLDRSLSTSRKAFEFTFKMLATGDIAVPAEGMGAISQQLALRAREAGVEIHTDETVTGVEAGGGDAGDGEVTVELGRETTTADAAVVATDPKQARDLTGVGSIPTEANGCVTQYYAFDGPELDAGRRILLNAGEAGPNQVVQLSSVAPEYAPDDRTLLSATFLGVADDPDEEFAARTARTLDSWYPERRLDLEPLHTARIEFAQFAQPPGVWSDLPDVGDPEGPVYLAGEYTEASSLNAAMESGRKAARAVAADHLN